MKTIPLAPSRSRAAYLASIGLFAAGLLAGLSGCTDGVIPGPGPGSDIFSTRKDLIEAEGGGSAGGAGGGSALGGGGGDSGAPVAGSEATVCTPGIYFIDDLPECFVAEISAAPLSCDADGRETLTAVREKRARQDECVFRGLNASDCDKLSVCGVLKVASSPTGDCLTGDDGTGFCVGPARADCPASTTDALTVVGVRPEAEALQVYCAVEDRL